MGFVNSNNNTLDVLRKLLSLTGVNVTDGLLKQIFDEKKIYNNSIVCIKEVLSELEIECKTFKLEEGDLKYLDYPCLAQIINESSYFVIVKEISNKRVIYYHSIKGTIEQRINEFLKIWSGIIILPFANKNSGDPDYFKNLAEEKKAFRFKILKYITLISSLFFVLISIMFFYPSYKFIYTLILINKVIGIIVSLIIIKIEDGESSPLIARVCLHFECERVLQSKGSRIFSWLSMGDIGLIYFTLGFLLIYIHSPIQSLNILTFINYFSLPYTIYSILYQVKIAKTICFLCCSIIALLWLEFILNLFLGHVPIVLNPNELIPIISSFLLAICLWITIKPILGKSILVDQYKNALISIKKDTDILKSNLIVKSSVHEFITQKELSLGCKSSRTCLIIILSPNCHSCRKLYFDLKDYIRRFPERLYVIFRFRGTESDESATNTVIHWILTSLLKDDLNSSFKIFESWGDSNHENIKKWEEENNLVGKTILPEAIKLRRSYNEWIDSLEIKGIPTMILNGKIIPVYYTFSDIKSLIRNIYVEEI